MPQPIAHLGELAALATAGCWTVSALVFEAAGKRIGSLSVNLVRLVMALMILCVYNTLRSGRPLPVDAGVEAWFWLGLSGLVGFVIGDLCLFRALVVVGARVAMLLMSLVPPMTAVIGWLMLGERLELFDWLGMLLTLGGVGWVIFERRSSEDGASRRLPLSGILLGLGGALGQALGLVLSKQGMGDLDPFAASSVRVVAGIVGFAVAFVFVGWWPRVVASLHDRRAMGLLLVGACFGPFLGVSLSLLAVRHTATGVAATIMALVPVLIIPVVILLHKERVSARAIAGAVLAVGGVSLLFLG